MNYKLLTRKNYILDSGILQKGTVDTIIPFENMEVEVVSTFQLGNKVTLATEEKVEELINASVVSSHKVIAGELEVTDATDAQAKLALYASGGDLTFTNGRVFNNGNSTPGEVFFMVPAVGSTVKAEEIIVGSNKDLIALSNENVIDAQFKSVEDRVTAVETDKTDNSDFIPVKDQVDLNTPAISTNSGDIVTLNNDLSTAQTNIATNTGDITTLKADVIRIDAKDSTQDGRLEALEQAESLDDKVWEGSIAGSASVDLSAIVDQNGNTFDFTNGKVLEVVIEKVSASLEQGHDLTIGKANATPYVIGQRTFNAKLDNTGHLSMVETGAGDLSDFNVIKVLEPKAAIAVSVSYTKNESDNKYATQASLATVDAKVDAIDFSGKQDSIDNSLTTTTKSVVGAINELKGIQSQDENLIANLGSLKTTDGDDLSTTTEDIVTAKTLADQVYTKAQADAAIAAAITAALNIVMDVTFDDLSTGSFKIGK